MTRFAKYKMYKKLHAESLQISNVDFIFAVGIIGTLIGMEVMNLIKFIPHI